LGYKPTIAYSYKANVWCFDQREEIVIGKGFQINLLVEESEEETIKLGLAGNRGSYGESIIRFVKREVSFYDDLDEDE